MFVHSTIVTIPVGDNEETSGVLLVPSEQKKTGVIIAHGADNDMYHPLLTAFAEGLSRQGLPTLRFNFLYREYGKKTPDKREKLIETWLAAFRFMKYGSGVELEKSVAAGKSLGGLTASRAAAEGILPVERLVLLGYPLHSMADKEKLRDSHLYNIMVPMLFFAGSRDPLCNIDKLKSVLSKLRTHWELEIVEKGDHSLHLPKSLGIDDADVYRGVVDKTIEWLEK